MGRFWKAAAVLGVAGLAAIVAKAAWADRVISDYEASKLTFSALIAPPSAYHHHSVARHFVAMAHHRSYAAPVQLARRHTAPSLVRNVAFRGRVIAPHARKSHKHRG
ncbi:hypothetical protein [Oecophyllibacter saccharovorans]|uniref:hypothetical protein n=1 Tax=Oecophyllibacter saccharovorans TaxID=2558360 RepID=UPI00114474CC|nr:hypothetical protein [Oecophyllibacter saccharovorans]QDH15799.1 hypothetical protein E3E11_07980 [Oecophyllibacter saccharovorans]TPW34639.1 hypothetical protein E3203_03545 [Oecophyllibacter saccharovorans]